VAKTQENTPVLLSVKDLNVKFNNHLILDNVSFDVKRDSTLAIIGPNGAGKTILFRAILGLIPFQGEVIWASDAKVGYVPQKLYVAKDFPLTVSELMHFKEKNHKKIHEILNSVGFKDIKVSHIHNDTQVLRTKLGALSSGELQRVLIAYALLGNPNVLLFDEPTSGVDVSAEETIYSLIDKLRDQIDLTIIFISHELQIVYRYADTVLCLNKEQVCFGPPREAVDKESLEKLYGEDVRFYKHHKRHDEHSH
jgi:zinc transport system ATP-binding protein